MNGALLDLESRAGDGDHEDLRLWLRWRSCTNLLETHVRRRLAEEFDTTLPRFDLLAQFERAPEGLKMGELSERLMVTGGNVTAITGSLEEAGYVRREVDPDDRRSHRVRITRTGLERFRRMAGAYETWIADQFSVLTAVQKRRLGAILQELKAHIRTTAIREQR